MAYEDRIRMEDFGYRKRAVSSMAQPKFNLYKVETAGGDTYYVVARDIGEAIQRLQEEKRRLKSLISLEAVSVEMLAGYRDLIWPPYSSLQEFI